MTYITETFDVVTFDQAKHVVLSTDPKNPKKFERETTFLVDKIQNQISIDENIVVLDFGCGMGRVSRELINRFNCKVIGVDISPSMLMFATLYTANTKKFVGTDSFTTPNSADIAISIFCLQHTENPQKEIDNIISVLKMNGVFVLLNDKKRLIPTDIDKEGYVIWEDDGFNVFDYVETKLKKIASVPYINEDCEIMFYQKI